MFMKTVFECNFECLRLRELSKMFRYSKPFY